MHVFRTIVAFDYPEAEYQNGETVYINRTKYLPLDYLDDRSITSSAKIVTQPLQNGDTMADHMYRNPTKLTLKGKFALNGRNWNNNSYGLIQNTGDRLTSIEYVYEYIKNNGILCTITTVDTEIDSPDSISYDSDGNIVGNINPGKTRFLTRENMALTDINWTEKSNILEFSFSFEEVMMIDTEVFQTEINDDLPSLNQPASQSLGTLLFDTGSLPQMVTELLYKKDYIQKSWLKRVCDEAEYAGEIFGQILIAAAVAVGVIAVSVAVAAGMTALAAALGTSVGAAAVLVPVGTVIAGAVVVGAAVVIGINKLIKRHKKKKKAKKAFKLVNDKTQPHLNRYKNFMDLLKKNINEIGSTIKIYQFTSDDEQEVCIPIGNNYYFITLTKTDFAPYFKSTIRVNGNTEKDQLITNKRAEFPAVADMFDLDENVNLWFKDENLDYQVYLLNPSLDDEINPTEDAVENVKHTLSSYFILVTSSSIKKEIKKVKNAIDDTISEFF